MALTLAGADIVGIATTAWSLVMRRAVLSLSVLTLLNLSFLLAQAAPTDTHEVFAAESSFAASMARRDLRAFAALVSTEAVFFSDTAALRGKEAVVDAWRKFFVERKPPFSWRPETVEVLSSGTLALTSGPVHGADGKLIGTFTSIWRQEASGVWRVIFDKGCPPPPERR
jgi:ketosteroid isomerase-like protein